MKKLILLLCVLVMFSCNRNVSLERTWERAGENRSELKKVLQHYKDDERKYDAALFLLERMADCYGYADAKIDSLKRLKVLSVEHGESPWLDSVKRVWSGFLYQQSSKIYDAQVMTADYLIHHIDHSFRIWDSCPWAKHYTFDDFCCYVLPYRIGTEPLEAWREKYYDAFAEKVDSAYGGGDVIKKVQTLRSLFFTDNQFRWNEHFSLPHLGAGFLLENRLGGCRESCDFTVYVLRSLGIPVATDFYKASPHTNGNHSWNVVKDTTGLIVPFWLCETDVERGKSDGRPKGKAFRIMYGGSVADVTAEYFGENQAEVMVECPDGVEEVELCVFSCGRIVPIDKIPIRNGKVVFRNLEPDIWFLPMYRDGKCGGRLSFAAHAFSLTADGRGRHYQADTLRRERVVLKRKYPYHQHVAEALGRMAGSRMVGSLTTDFRQTVPLCTLQVAVETNRVVLPSESLQPVRYVRLHATPAKFEAELAELAFREADSGKMLPFMAVELPEPCDVRHGFGQMTDGDVLTFYRALQHGDCTLTFDLGAAYRIGSIDYVSRNDDNFVSKGDVYELFYQDGVNGWQSLGRQEATSDSLIYDNVPKGALLWLRDLTKGREEQLFIMTENGKQDFV